MRIILFLLSALLTLSSHSFCQVYTVPISFPKFSPVERNVYMKFFNDKKKIIFLDYKEGLSLHCDSVQTDSTREKQEDAQNMPYLFGKYWRSIENVSKEGLTVYIPDDQNIDSWREMISIQRIDAEGQNSMKLYSVLMKAREKRCPGKSHSEIIEDSKHRTFYKSITQKCGEFESQSELSIILSPPKFLLMQYTLWKVEYVVKYGDQEAYFTYEMLDWFRNIELLTGKELEIYLNSN